MKIKLKTGVGGNAIDGQPAVADSIHGTSQSAGGRGQRQAAIKGQQKLMVCTACINEKSSLTCKLLTRTLPWMTKSGGLAKMTGRRMKSTLTKKKRALANLLAPYAPAPTRDHTRSSWTYPHPQTARGPAKRHTPSSVSLPDEAMEEAYTDEDDDDDGLGLGRGTRLGAQDEVATDYSALELKPDHVNRCGFWAVALIVCVP